MLEKFIIIQRVSFVYLTSNGFLLVNMQLEWKQEAMAKKPTTENL